MRSSGKADLAGLIKLFKEQVDPEFVRFENSWKSRSLTELARLAALFKQWNDNPSGPEAALDTPVSAPSDDGTPCEQLLQELEQRLTAAHAEELGKLEAQLRESVHANDQVIAALARNTNYDKTIAGLLARLPWTGFDTPINELRDLLTPDSRAYCRVHGILFAGELWALKDAPTGVESDIVALCEKWNVSRTADVISQGYLPRYWLNPAFYTTCGKLVTDVLRPGVYARRTRMESYLDQDQTVGDFFRKWRGVPGKLQDFQHCLDKSHADAIHAGCYVPDEWAGE